MALQAEAVEAEDGRSRVDTATDLLALRIASGTYRPGELLPSVRSLAKSLAINPSTVQVVLARLSSLGFVEARRGVGVAVRDIRRDGGIETWGYVFRFAQQLPERAARVFADLLALRRTLVVDMLRAIARNPKRYPREGTRRAVEQLALLVVAGENDLYSLARVEIDAFRELTLSIGQSAATAVLNSIGEIYLSEPAAMRAMYENPALHVSMWKLLLDEWDAGGLTDATADRVRDWLTTFDAAVVERYAASLRASQEGR